MRVGPCILFAVLVGAASGGISAMGADQVRWSSVEALFPGPKPQKGVLSPDDTAPWKAQAAQQRGIPGVSYGDEKAWRFGRQSATLVALRMPFSVGCKHGPPGFIVGVLDADGRRLARSKELFSEGGDVESTRKSYRLDTAPYRISDTETAFGVRIVHYYPAKHWCYADQVLHLFRVVGDDVVRILTTDAFYEQFDQIEETEESMNGIVVNNPECSFSYDEAFPPKGRGAVLRMLSTQTHGFYDIQRTQKGSPGVTYRWNGQRYVMDGKDPVDHHVREEWDWCTGRRYLADHGLPVPTAPAVRPEARPSPASTPAPGKH